MVSVPTPAPAPPARPDPTPRRSLALAAIVGVVVVGVVLRLAVRSDLWLDEALTVNIARVPLGDLRAALRVDGAPPLYYLLLHVWMGWFGEGDAAVRALPALLGILGLPLAYLAGRRIGGPDSTRAHRVGLIALVLMAASPYAIRYSSENRMYILVIDLVLVGYIGLRRALDRPSIGRLVAVAVVVAAGSVAVAAVATTGGVAAAVIAARLAADHGTTRMSALVSRSEMM